MLKLIRSSGPEPKPAKRGDDLADLVQAVLRGELRATRTLVIALGPQLLRVVRRVLGPSHPDVEDVTQEATFAVLDALDRYRGECSVLHFACRIAVLTAMNTRRRDEAEKRTALRPSAYEVDDVAAHQPSPEAALTTRAKTTAVRELLATLPEAQAEALALHTVLGYTVAEIAASSQLSPETVRSRLRLARRALRERLNSDPVLRELLGGDQ